MADGNAIHDWFDVTMIVIAWAVTLSCLAILLWWVSRGRWMGCLIVNASKPRSRIRIFVYAGYAALWLAAVATAPFHYLFSYNSVMLVTLGTALATTGVLEIRERGLFSDFGVIFWDRVKTWSWENAGGLPTTQWSGAVKPGPATMKIELTRPVFFRRSVRIVVPFAFVDSVARTMDERVPD